MAGVSASKWNLGQPGSSENQAGLDRFQTRVLLSLGWTLLLVAVVAILYFGRHLLLISFAGVLVANFFYRLVAQTDRWFTTPRKLRLGLLVAVIILLIAAFGYAVGQKALNQVDDLSGQIQSAYQSVIDQARSTRWGSQILTQLPEASGSQSVVSRVASWFASSFGFLIDVVVLVAVALYLMFSPKQYISGLVALTPPPKRSWFRRMLDENGELLYRWVLGRLASMSVVAILVAGSLWWLGLPMPIMLGIFAGLACFVPNIGPFIGITPAVLLAFQQGQGTVWWVAGVYLLIQTVESYLMTPLIQQHQVSVPPALVIVMQVLAGTLFGFWGIALATPLLETAMFWTDQLYVKSFLEKHWEPTRATADG